MRDQDSEFHRLPRDAAANSTDGGQANQALLTVDSTQSMS